MRCLLFTSMVIAGSVPYGCDALAMNCTKATSAIEHMICGDQRLLRADAAMGEAYAKILQSTHDGEIRAMLVTSQTRWIAARDKRLGRLADTDSTADKDSQRSIVLQAMTDRTSQLAEMSNRSPHQPRLVQLALEQRRVAAGYTGGPFAGFDTSCDFLPGRDRVDYACFGTHRYQNKDRVCSVTQDWASGSVSEFREVADVVGGDLKLIATCQIGGTGSSPCPEDGGGDGRTTGWNVHPVSPPGGGRSVQLSLPKLDAEISDDGQSPWLHACLTDKSFPAVSPGDTGAPK